MGTAPQTSSARAGHQRGDGPGPFQRQVRSSVRGPWSRLRSPLTAAAALVAATTLGALTAPSCAAAMVRLPDPPAPWSWPVTDVSTVVTTIAENYPNAPLTQRRRLHDDMLLEVNAPWSAI